ncbi:MAG: outer membrane lipoprotein carrier protein LolA [Amylibacter sp.]
MNRRFFITALGAAPLVSFGSIASAQNAVVDELNAYLNSLLSATAPFTQESADGSTATGTFYLQKPGKMRFEYDPPSPALLVADGSALAIFDKKSNRGPQRYPQSSTPLSLLTRSDIDIRRSRFVQKLEAGTTQMHLTMFDPDRPGNGSIKMIFDRNPMALIEWIIVDGSGLESVVKLGKLTTNISLDSALFSIQQTIRTLNSGG